MKMRDDFELSDSDDEMMQDTADEEKTSHVEDEKKLALRQQELEEAAQYYEPIDESQDGAYFVKSFDANTEKWRWKADFSKMGAKQYSPVFTIAGTHQFRLLVFPRGNQVPSISLYLDTNNSSDVKLVRFQISILNQKDIRESHSQGLYLSHIFIHIFRCWEEVRT